MVVTVDEHPGDIVQAVNYSAPLDRTRFLEKLNCSYFRMQGLY